MSNQLYAHPDGHSIDIEKGMLTVTDSDGQTASVPIGEIGLTELGERMVSIGQTLIAKRGTTEQAGYEQATDAQTVYNHPDGFTLAFTDNTLIATDEDGKTVCLPIGPLGLVELAAKLNAIGNDAGNLAEQAGAGIGIDCLNALLAADTQGKRIRAIQSAVLDLQCLAHPKRAAGGFAGAVVNVLEIGIANLPAFEGDEQ